LLFYYSGRAAALQASGFNWEQLASCAHWMSPVATVLQRYEIPPVLPAIEGVPDEYRHLIQSHCITLEMMVNLKK
jgi:hypothetical protein